MKNKKKIMGDLMDYIKNSNSADIQEESKVIENLFNFSCISAPSKEEKEKSNEILNSIKNEDDLNNYKFVNYIIILII